jgi:hypothetical protein
MDRSNHYEAAFAEFLRHHHIGHIAVDETRRSCLGLGTVKSLDFVIVHSASGAKWLVDVKGRRYPGGRPERPKRTWECWTMMEDVTAARQWAAAFGPDYHALFVFAYHLVADSVVLREDETLWSFRDARYALRGIRADEYAEHMRRRSQRWNTVSLPNRVYRQLAQPLHVFLPELAPAVTAAAASEMVPPPCPV